MKNINTATKKELQQYLRDCGFSKGDLKSISLFEKGCPAQVEALREFVKNHMEAVTVSKINEDLGLQLVTQQRYQSSELKLDHVRKVVEARDAEIATLKRKLLHSVTREEETLTDLAVATAKAEGLERAFTNATVTNYKEWREHNETANQSACCEAKPDENLCATQAKIIGDRQKVPSNINELLESVVANMKATPVINVKFTPVG